MTTAGRKASPPVCSQTTKVSSRTHSSFSYPSTPPSPPPVDSPPHPQCKPHPFYEQVSDWFLRNNNMLPDPIYTDRLITPPSVPSKLPPLALNPTIMASVPPAAVPLPLRQSANAPRFDPSDHSTLQVYLSDYELAADVALLTPAERLSQST